MEPFIALEMCGGVPVFSVVFQLLLIWRVFREGILYSPMLAEEKIQGWFADAPHCSQLWATALLLVIGLGKTMCFGKTTTE